MSGNGNPCVSHAFSCRERRGRIFLYQAFQDAASGAAVIRVLCEKDHAAGNLCPVGLKRGGK